MDEIKFLGYETIDRLRAQKRADDSAEVLMATLESLDTFPGVTDALDLETAKRFVRLAHETNFWPFLPRRIIRGNWKQDGPHRWAWIEATPEFALHLARRGMDECGNEVDESAAAELVRKWSACCAHDAMMEAVRHLKAAEGLLPPELARRANAINREAGWITRAIEL